MTKLFLIPTSLNPEINAPAILPEQSVQIRHIKHFIVETAKIGRAHLKQLNLNSPIQQLEIQELNKHNEDIAKLIAPLKNGLDMGIISDCGCPAIADPGSTIVAFAHETGTEVIPLIGPSSIILALMASGLNGQNFIFHGYLPNTPEERKLKLKDLQHQTLKDGTTHIFIEAPFRNQKLFSDMLTILHPGIKVCLGINLMTDKQQILTKTIKSWQQESVETNKQEVIFLIGG